MNINSTMILNHFTKISNATFIIVIYLVCEARGMCVNYDLPKGCVCTNYTDGELLKIVCENANLTSLPPGLPPADHIRIENNTIDIVTHVPYADTVKYMYLPLNKIRLVQDGAFSNLTKLRTLNLKSNEITSLRKTTFLGLVNLKTLVLSGNPMYVLKADTIDGLILPQLENLNLDACQMYKFEDSALDSLNNLQFLTLSNNKLQDFPIMGCPGHSLENLITFDVSHNQITHIEPSHCFLPRLLHLNLRYNQLRSLNSSFYGSAIEYLKSLRVSHNNISAIDVHAFNGSLNLTTLDISSNNLRELDSDTVPWEQVISVVVGDNPWKCDCKNIWLISRDAVTKNNKKESVRCSSPENVYNRSVFSVYKTAFEHCYSKSHKLSYAVGGICVILAVIIVCVVLYFVVRKQRTHRPVDGSSASGLTTGSSIYRRMNTDNDVLFDYSSGSVTESRETPQRSVWKEMDAYEQNNNPHTQPDI